MHSVKYFCWRMNLYPERREAIEDLILKHTTHAELLNELIHKHLN